MKTYWWKKGLCTLLAVALVLTSQPFTDGSSVVHASAQEEISELPEDTEGQNEMDEEEEIPGQGVDSEEEEVESNPAESNGVEETELPENVQTDEEKREETDEETEKEVIGDSMEEENVPEQAGAEINSDEELEEPSLETDEETAEDGEQVVESAEEAMDTLQSDPESEIIELDMATYVNPLYEDVVDPSDLNQIDDNESGIMTASEDDIYESAESAAVMVRGEMTSRNEQISVKIQLEEEVGQDLYYEIMNYALQHTGNPVEGDYLLWQYAGWKASASYSGSGGIYTYTVSFALTYYTTAEQEEQMDEAVTQLLGSLNLYDSADYQKICGIYDYICENVTYDYDNLEDDDYKLKFTAYAALENKTAVCQGYSALFYRLALELGVDARLISGIGNGGAHGWNIVELNGLYYNLDSTWDAAYCQAGRSYEYFLKCNDNFGDHIRSDEYSTDEFNENYPMSSEDYVPVKSGLVFAANLYWEWDEEAQTDVIKGIYRTDGENGEYLSIAAGTDWESEMAALDVSCPEDTMGFDIPYGYMALFYMEYDDSTDSYKYKVLSAGDIEVSGDSGLTITGKDDYYLELYASKPGEFVLSYTAEDAAVYTLPVVTDWPQVGIYSDVYQSEDTLYSGSIRFNNDHRTFYLGLSVWDEENSIALAEEPFRFETDVENEADGMLTCMPVEGYSGWYELKINSEMEDSFGLWVTSVVTEPGDTTFTDERFFWFEKAQDSGLALAGDLDFDDEGNVNGIWADGKVLGSDDKDSWIEAMVNGKISHSFPRDGEQTGVIPEAWFSVFLAEYNIESDEDYTFTPLSADQITIEADDGENISWDLQGDYVHIVSKTGGSCTLSYTTEDGRIYTQDFSLGLPGTGFYDSEERNTDSFLSNWQYGYNSENRIFYLIYAAHREEDRSAGALVWEVNGEELDEAGLGTYISCEDISSDAADFLIKKITVAENCMDDFGLAVTVPYVSNEDENDVETERQEIYVYRGQDTGLVFSADLQRDDEGNVVGILEDSYSRAGDSGEFELTEVILSVAFSSYDEEEGWVYAPLSYEDLTFTATSEDIALEAVAGADGNNYLRLFSNISDGCPSGIISYTIGDGDEAQTYELQVGFCYPEVSFYYDKEHTQLISNEYIYSGSADLDEVIYLYSKSRDENQEIQILGVEYDGNAATFNAVDGIDGLYMIDFSQFASAGDFDLYVNYGFRDVNAGENEYHRFDYRSITCRRTGLVLAWPDWEDDVPVLGDECEWESARNMNITNCAILGMGIRDSSGDVRPVSLSEADNISIMSEAEDFDGNVHAAVWFAQEGEAQETNFIELNIPYSGDYILTYITDEVTYTAKISAGLPQIGFYTDSTPSDESYLVDEEFIYESYSGAELYLIAWENGDSHIDMKDLRLEVEDGLGEVDGYLVYDDVTLEGSDYVVWRVTVRANAAKEFGLRARAEYYYTDEDGNTWQTYDENGYVYVRNEAEKTRVSYYDGEAYTGYRACFISEMEFQTGYLNTYYGDDVYWVHGDTITEAMEKLVALSGTEVTASDGTKLTVVNTGYIHVGTSTFYEYQDDLREEGVIIPDGILGVQMDEDYNRQFLMSESEDGSYITDQTAQVYRAEGGNVEFCGITFWIEEGSTFAKMEGTWYYCEPVADGSGYIRCLDDEGEYAAIAGGNIIAQAVLDLIIPVADNVYMVYDTGASFPELHIAVSADVTINGSSMPDALVLGFYEDSEEAVTIMDCKDIEYVFEDGSSERWDGHVNLTADSEGGTFEKYIYYYDEEMDRDVTGTKAVNVSIHRIQPLEASLTGSGSAKASWDTAGLEKKLQIPSEQSMDIIAGAERSAALNIDTATASEIGSAKVKAINTKAGILLGSTYYSSKLTMSAGENSKDISSVPNGTLSITLPLPSSFDQSQGTVKVVRYYDGTAQVLTSSVKSGSVTFKTDKLGIFAVVLVSNLKYKVSSTASKTIAVTGTSVATATKLVIPATVQYQGSSYKVTAVNSNAFKNNTKLKTVTIGSNVTTLGASSFYGCTALATLTIGSSVTSIGNNAFYKCTALTKATIPSKVTSIGTSAFQGCTKLATVSVGSAVKTIGNNAFYGCSALKTLTIGAAVTSIGSKAFYGCKTLTKVTIPNKVTSIGTSAFQGCTKLATVSVGSAVKTIGNNAFYGCSALKTLTIGAAVTSIGSKAFYGCTALTKVTIPNKVTSIGTSAFQGCTKLAALTIGTGVTSIGSNAFYGCKVLKTITINTTKLTNTKVGSNAFKGIYAKASIKVPSSKLSSYKTILKAKGVSSTATIK